MPGHGKQMILHCIVSIYNAITQIRGITFTNNLGIAPWEAQACRHVQSVYT